MPGTFCSLHQTRRSPAGSCLLLTIIVAAITGMARGHTILEEYSCGQGDIEYQVTLKGGTQAGLFHKHGKVKNIHECIHHCCQSKKCDVAMMMGQQCFGVQCLNETVCESVPAPPGASDAFQISHVSSKGLGFLEKKKAAASVSLHDDNFEAREDRCPFNGVMYNVKLKGGLKAGRFTDVGKVKSVNTCIRYCCDSKVPCDLSFMLEDRCYLVKCYSEERCEAVPANSHDFQFKQRMAFVSPWLFKRNKKIMKVPSGLHLHHLKCVQTKLHTNTDLVGGPYAGDFKDMGKVGKPHRCTRMCCEDQDCDVAYMVGENCFLVKCYNDELCRLKTHNTTLSDDIKKSTRSVQFIVKRDFDVTMDDKGHVRERHPDRRKCSMDGQIHNNTELLLGMLSGKLTPHTKVKKMNECFGKCCEDKSCHVAVMNSGMCYSVHCDQPHLCQTKPASEAGKARHTQVAYVMRGEDSIYVAPPPPPPLPPKQNITLQANKTASVNETASMNKTEVFNSTALLDYYVHHYNMSHNATTAWFDKNSNSSMAGLIFSNNTWSYNPFWNITNINLTELEMSGSGSGMGSGIGTSGGEADDMGEEEEDDDEPPIEIVDEEDEAEAEKKLKAKSSADFSGSGEEESSDSGSKKEDVPHVSREGDVPSGDGGSGVSHISGESEDGSALEHVSGIEPFSVPKEDDESGSDIQSAASGSAMASGEGSGEGMQEDEVKASDGSGVSESGSGSSTEVHEDQVEGSAKDETNTEVHEDQTEESAKEDSNTKEEGGEKEKTSNDAAESESDSEDDPLAGLLTPVEDEKGSKKDDTPKSTKTEKEEEDKHKEEENKLKTMLENEAKKDESSGETASGESESKKEGEAPLKESSATSSGESSGTIQADDSSAIKGESTEGSGSLSEENHSGSGKEASS